MIEKARITSGNTSKEFNRYLDIAKANSDLLMSLISDILDYSQTKQNKFKLNISWFILSKIVKEVFELMNIQAELKKIFLAIEYKIEDDLEVNSDEKRIKQVLINLIGNAIKFTKPNGKVKIIVSLETREEKLIKLMVEDSGIGMKEEIISKLGKPFATFDTEGSMNKQGIGLGLNICQKIVGAIGPYEKLFISSTIGKGSTFTVFFYPDINQIQNKSIEGNETINEIKMNNNYQTEEDDNFKISLRELEDIQEFERIKFKKPKNYNTDYHSSFLQSLPNSKSIIIEERKITPENTVISVEKKKINVLTVDDNVFNLLVLSEMLTQATSDPLFCYETNIIEANSGEEAVQIYVEMNEENKKIDVIIMDVEMTGMSGIEATKIIKKIGFDKGYDKTYIFGHTSNEDKNELFEAGMDEILDKPTKLEQLKLKIRSIFVK